MESSSNISVHTYTCAYSRVFHSTTLIEVEKAARCLGGLTVGTMFHLLTRFAGGSGVDQNTLEVDRVCFCWNVCVRVCGGAGGGGERERRGCLLKNDLCDTFVIALLSLKFRQRFQHIPRLT